MNRETMSKNNEPITSFEGEFEFLSNFYSVIIVHDEKLWKTSEHLFQSMKTVNPFQKDFIFQAPTPGQAKRRGKQVPLRKDWEYIKRDVMKLVVVKKFLQNPKLLEKLLNTGNALLIEGNNWHDNEWGNCACDSCKDIEGKNMLGKILMEIRDI